MTKPSIQTLAGHVLSTGEASSQEARRLAAAVLGDDSLTPPPVKTRKELEDLLERIDGMEGQSERAAEIRRQLDLMGDA